MRKMTAGTADDIGADERGGDKMGWIGTIVDRLAAGAVIARTGSKSTWESAQRAIERTAKRRVLTGDRYTINVRDNGNIAEQDYLLRGVPDDVWRRAKSIAAKRGTTVRELIIQALRGLQEK